MTQYSFSGTQYRSTKDIAATVRQALKQEMPGWKFSVVTESFSGGSAINLALMAGPEPVLQEGRAWGGGYAQLNHYTLLQRGHEGQGLCNGAHLTPTGWQVMRKAAEILSREHWDESDSQIDYFHCAFYMHVNIGKWNKPYQVEGAGKWRVTA